MRFVALEERLGSSSEKKRQNGEQCVGIVLKKQYYEANLAGATKGKNNEIEVRDNQCLEFLCILEFDSLF